MSRIFISHSSANNAEAIALRDWLAMQGFDDVFLDIDPDRGLKAGERWEQALNAAANRCEAVLFLVSRDWIASSWCRKEMSLAHRLNKRMFGVLIEELPIEEAPRDLSGEWQLISLASGRDGIQLAAVLPVTHAQETVTFSAEGLQRLRHGLENAGLDPKYFAWPPEADPDRPPYRGFLPLEAEDAGIYFGREAEIVVALDALRGLREAAAPRIFVMLGASGAGKSSMLRAGLIPRLSRDDRHFLPLPVIRPERAAISGEAGLLRALEGGLKAKGISRARADLRSILAGGAEPMKALLQELVERSTPRTSSGSPQTQAPTVVLCVDQAEELFNPEGAEEAQQFLSLLADLVKTSTPDVIAVFTIRTDAYEPLQASHGPAAALAELKQVTFSLPPMAQGSYQSVIEGPAARLTQSGRKLTISPDLTAALLRDIEQGGAKDALPLLAFTLERLYVEHGGDAHLTLADYEALGGIKGAIEAAIDQAFAAANADQRIPRDAEARRKLLRRGLIPWLAGIDPDTASPRRRVARLSQIPSESRPLIDLLVKVRLLATDRDAQSGEATIEPAHEALLRQWGTLQGWLEEDFAALAILEGVKRTARDWDANAKRAAWLAHSGTRLDEAERTGRAPAFAEFLTLVDREYLGAARAAQTARLKRENFFGRVIRTAAVVAMIAAGLAGWQWWEAEKQTEIARLARDESQLARSRFLADLSTTELGAKRPDKALALALEAVKASPNANEPNPEATRALLAATNVYNNLTFKPDLRLLGHEGTVRGVAYSRETNLALTWSGDRTARLWNGKTGEPTAILKHDAGVMLASFAAKGASIVSKQLAGPVRLWRGESFNDQKVLSERASAQYLLAPSGDIVFVWDDAPTMVAWDVRTGEAVGKFTHQSAVQGAKLTGDGARLLTYSKDKTLHIWEANAGSGICSTPYDSEIAEADFTPDGRNAWSLEGGKLKFFETNNCTQVGDATADIENSKSVSAQGRVLAWGKNRVSLFDNAGSNLGTFTASISDGSLFQDASISPDAQFILAWTYSGEFFLWGRSEAEATKRGRLSGTINGGIFRNDSKEMAIWTTDGIVELWDLSGDKPPMANRRLQHGGSVERAAYSGELLTSRSLDGTYRLWDRSGRELGRLGFDGPITSAAIADQGRLLIGSADGSALLFRWDRLGQGKLVKHTDKIEDIVFSSDGSVLVSWGKDGSIQAFRVSQDERFNRTKISLPPISGVSVATRGDAIAAWHASTIWFASFDGQTPMELAVPGEVAAVEFDRAVSVALIKLKSGTHAIARRASNRRWDLSEGPVHSEFSKLVGRARDTLLTIAGGQLSFRSLSQNAPISTSPINRGTYEVEVAEGADTLIVKVGVDSLLVYDAKTGSMMPEGSLTGVAVGLSLSHDGTRLGTWDNQGLVTIWSLDRTVQLLWRHASGDFVRRLQLAPNGNRALIVHHDRVDLWDLNRLSLSSFIPRSNLHDARFSSSGRYVLTHQGVHIDFWESGSSAWLGRIENVGYKAIASSTSQAVAWIRASSEIEIRNVNLEVSNSELIAFRLNQPIMTSLSVADNCRAKINEQACATASQMTRAEAMLRHEKVPPDIAAKDIGARWGSLSDFLETEVGVYTEFGVKADGKIAVFHNQRFKRLLQSIVIDKLAARIYFVSSAGAVRPVPHPVERDLFRYIRHTNKILMVGMDKEMKTAIEGYYLPLYQY